MSKALAENGGAGRRLGQISGAVQKCGVRQHQGRIFQPGRGVRQHLLTQFVQLIGIYRLFPKDSIGTQDTQDTL